MGLHCVAGPNVLDRLDALLFLSSSGVHPDGQYTAQPHASAFSSAPGRTGAPSGCSF